MFLLIQGSEVKHAYSHPKRQEADEQLHYQQHPQHSQQHQQAQPPMMDWCQVPDSAAPQPEPEPVYTGGSAEVSGYR